RIVKDGVLLWEYNFPFEMRNYLLAPWRSALAQGQAISVLIRAHQLTGDERYAQSAHQGYRAFYYKARDHEGGVLDDQDGFIWLEEYIVKPPNHVLNGFIWALWGVRDYAVYFENSHAQNLWEECLKTLEANLKNYDIGFWTSYDWTQGYDGDLPIMPSSLYYQELHSIQMLGMYNLTGNKLYLDYYEKWSSYLQSYWKRVISQTWKIYFKVRYF
ncbi:MAG: D-glucuronyl C5-epimerase, partial [Candidatus Gottesmanbacteria bacterium GW2011_GWC2_39_8]